MRDTTSIRSGAGFGGRIARPFCSGLPQGPMSVFESLVSVTRAIEPAASTGKDTALRWDLVASPACRAPKMEEITSDPKRTKGLFRLERR